MCFYENINEYIFFIAKSTVYFHLSNSIIMHSYDYFADMISTEVENLRFNRKPRELYEPVEYILSIGGKRLRPVVTLMTCELFDGDIQKAIMPAIGMEMFHNFTLMHDDIMDKASSRRGKPTVHAKWDENRAILSGDAMLILANQLMLKADDDILREVMELYNKSGLMVCDGQQYDMNFEAEFKITIDDYIQMIELKTAALLASSSLLGAVIAKASPENKELIDLFGFNLGISFQIEDDILDVYGDYNKFGKNIGGDILANKKTFLLVKAMQTEDKELLNELKSWTAHKDYEPKEKIQKVTEIFDKLEVKKHARESSKFYYLKSLSYLDKIKLPTEKKHPLSELANYLVNRQA